MRFQHEHKQAAPRGRRMVQERAKDCTRFRPDSRGPQGNSRASQRIKRQQEVLLHQKVSALLQLSRVYYPVFVVGTSLLHGHRERRQSKQEPEGYYAERGRCWPRRFDSRGQSQSEPSRHLSG